MRSVREIVAGGITTQPQLQEALQLAIQLEFSTIPPYLCAEWSINQSQDTSRVYGMIHDVVMQEMLHFGLACNMLTAIGGTPQIAQASFVPNYPVLGLPGGVQPGLLVDLLPLGPQALNTFMQIEYPETGLLGGNPNSIGAFYDTIAGGFVTVQPAIVADAFQKEYSGSIDSEGDTLTAITSVDEGGSSTPGPGSALYAINLIKDQGEGTSTSPDQGTFDPNNLAHYYTFAQIYYGNTLVQVDGQYQFASPAIPITLPAVFTFAPSNATPDPSAAFNTTFSDLLHALQSCWAAGGSLGSALGIMSNLGTAGQNLIQQQGVRPEFKFVAATAGSVA
jgi:Ferritin-like